jgi:hypothetical protein
MTLAWLMDRGFTVLVYRITANTSLFTDTSLVQKCTYVWITYGFTGP